MVVIYMLLILRKSTISPTLNLQLLQFSKPFAHAFARHLCMVSCHRSRLAYTLEHLLCSHFVGAMSRLLHLHFARTGGSL